MNPKIFPVIAALIGLGACATPVPQQRANFVPNAPQALVRMAQIDADAAIDVGTGYARTLPRGTVLKFVGSIDQGDVYRPVNYVLTLEGANIHEVYIVVNRTDIVGFFMPVELAFVPSRAPILNKFSIRG